MTPGHAHEVSILGCTVVFRFRPSHGKSMASFGIVCKPLGPFELSDHTQFRRPFRDSIKSIRIEADRFCERNDELRQLIREPDIFHHVSPVGIKV